ncbi:MAG TPA: DUF4215 domain-containing protein, partial [Nannocystis sp.]
CTDQCTTPTCGDSFVQASLGEACDLGGQNSDAGACTLGCKTAVCGDALVQAGVEQCDAGANNGNSKACKANCTDNVCGDGFVEVGVEDCDDANAVDNDACSNVCKAASCNDGIKNGQEVDVDCGGPTCGLCPTVILLAGGNTGPNGHVGATFTNALGWSTTPLAGVTVTDLDLTMTSANVGVGVLRYTKINDPLDNRLQYTVWNNGVWTPVNQVSNFTTFHAPAIDSADTTAQVVFRGTDANYYYTAFVNNAWTAAQATGASGPIAGDIAALGANAAYFYANQATNRMNSVDRQNAVWTAPLTPYGIYHKTIQPNLIRMTAGAAELMAVWPYINPDEKKVRFGVRVNGVWQANQDVPSVLTTYRVGTAPLPLGRVALVYHGMDDKLYASLFTGGQWSPSFGLPGEPTITGTPAVVQGIGIYEAEVAYISAGQVWHTRFDADTFTWKAPVVVGGANMQSVALARSK